MKKEGKQGIAEALSLMKRMEMKGLTGFQGKMLKEEMINEAIKKERVQVTRDQIIDILNNAKPGQFASIIMVYDAGIYGTKKSWKNDEVEKVLNTYKDDETRGGWYDTLKDYHENGPVTNRSNNPLRYIVSIVRYVLHWDNTTTFDNKYNKFALQRKDIRAKYNLPEKWREGTNKPEKTTYGPLVNKNGDIKLRQNCAKPRTKITGENYFIDQEGHICEMIPGDVVAAIKAIKPKGPEKSAVEALGPEVAQMYWEEMEAINKISDPRDFFYDKMLAVVCTVNGTPYYYINDNVLTKVAKEVYVDKTELVDIAKEKLGQAFNAVDNFAIEQKHML